MKHQQEERTPHLCRRQQSERKVAITRRQNPMMTISKYFLTASVAFCLSVASVQAFAPVNMASSTSSTALAAGADEPAISRRSLMSSATCAVITASAFLISQPKSASARLESVNRPELLPKESGLNVIQTEKFLTPGQVRRMDTLLSSLERDTGFRVRVLCQNYPNTPGLAIRDYWDVAKEGQKDDKYVILVIDQFGGKGNILNVNVGDGVKFALPNIFWTRLQSKYGTTFYVRDNGIDLAVTNAVEAIVSCLRSEDGYCTSPPDEGQSMRGLGFN